MWDARGVKMKLATVVFFALLCAAAAAQDNNSEIFKLAYQKSLEEAGTVYPDLKNQNSRLWQIANRIAMEARNPNSPNHAILSSPNAPRIVADMAAKELAAELAEEARQAAAKKAEEEERASWPKYVRATRSIQNVKTTLGEGWDLDLGEVYPFVRYMTQREYDSDGRVPDSDTTDKSYVVLQMDNGVVVVPADAVEALPKTDAAIAAAERKYEAEVRQKKRLDQQAQQQGDQPQ